MRCVMIDGIKKFKIGNIEEPTAKHGRVLIDVLESGICGSDIHYWVSGEPKGLVMGHEFSGKVVDNGGRSDLKIGDRVTALPISPCDECSACLSGNHQYCAKTWSEAVGLSLTNPGALSPRISVRSDMVMKLPDTVSDIEGSLVEPTAVSLHAVHLADIKVGDKVLVIGGGIIGLLCAMFAKMEGASYVAISEVNKKRGNKAVDLEVADEFFDAKDTDLVNKTNCITGGGFDIVIDCCGNSPAVSNAIMAVKPGGMVILVGVSLGTVTIPSVVAVMRELTIKGSIAYTKEDFQTCIDLIANKRIDVLKFVDDVVGYSGVQKAYERLTSGDDAAVKIIVDPTKE